MAERKSACSSRQKICAALRVLLMASMSVRRDPLALLGTHPKGSVDYLDKVPLFAEDSRRTLRRFPSLASHLLAERHTVSVCDKSGHPNPKRIVLGLRLHEF